MDFPGLLSLEASLGNRSADQSINETLFFYRIIDVSRQTELTCTTCSRAARGGGSRRARGGVLAG
jgi:hypothetical protein